MQNYTFKCSKFFYFQKKEKKKCKFCDWETVDTENKSGQYTSHLKKFHNKTISEYVKEFPEERELFKNQLQKIELREFMEKNPKNNSSSADSNEPSPTKNEGGDLKPH